MIGGSRQLKFREAYAKSAKTEQSGLGNWIIRFSRLNILTRKHTPFISGIH
jgi:hypothetical protein